MKTCMKSLMLPVLVAALGSVQVNQAMAQTFTTLHSFTGGSEGDEPHAGLISSGNTLYGTTAGGGSFGGGTIFKLNTDGTGFRTLHSFTFAHDGASPGGDLILSSNILYGTAQSGTNSGGSLFALNIDRTGFATLYSFTTISIAVPQGMEFTWNT